jgi:hypothetical protein
MKKLLYILLFFPLFVQAQVSHIISGDGETVIDSLAIDHVYGDSTVWDDLRVPAQNTKLNPIRSEPEFESWIDGTFAYHFEHDNASDESVHFATQIPHGYKYGTDIHPHVHWSPDNTNTDTVAWELEYTISNINDAFPTTTLDTIYAKASGTADDHQLAEFTPIDGASITLSAVIVCRLTRLGALTEDNFTGNAVFLEFDFHYQFDQAGSFLEYSKRY